MSTNLNIFSSKDHLHIGNTVKQYSDFYMLLTRYAWLCMASRPWVSAQRLLYYANLTMHLNKFHWAKYIGARFHMYFKWRDHFFAKKNEKGFYFAYSWLTYCIFDFPYTTFFVDKRSYFKLVAVKFCCTMINWVVE